MRFQKGSICLTNLNLELSVAVTPSAVKLCKNSADNLRKIHVKGIAIGDKLTDR